MTQITENPNRVLLWKDERHSHFWISDGELYESYQTIRGLRYRHRCSVGDLPDAEKCSEPLLKYIEAEFLN